MCSEATKYRTGPVTVGKHSCWTALVLPTARPIQGGRGHQKPTLEQPVKFLPQPSKVSTPALSDQLFLNRQGCSVPLSSPKGTKLEWEPTSWLLSGQQGSSGCRVAGLARFAAPSQFTFQHLLYSVSLVYSKSETWLQRNKDPTATPPAFRVRRSQRHLHRRHRVFAESLLSVL